MSTLLATKLVSVALLPPLSLFLLLFAGLILHRRHRRFAMSVTLFASTALYALSTPWVGSLLQKSLEIAPPVSVDALRRAEAIVVLGGGRLVDALEYGGDTLNATSLERLRYAVRLHRASGIPLLVAGGKPDGGELSEAHIMQQVLEREFGVSPRWLEPDSLTTWDNARLSAPLLKNAGIERIALVSHAWHLRRAVPLFETQGLAVIPAGTQFADPRVGSVFDVLPSASGLRRSTFALHEWLGILWYKLRTQLA